MKEKMQYRPVVSRTIEPKQKKSHHQNSSPQNICMGNGVTVAQFTLEEATKYVDENKAKFIKLVDEFLERANDGTSLPSSPATPGIPIFADVEEKLILDLYDKLNGSEEDRSEENDLAPAMQVSVQPVFTPIHNCIEHLKGIHPTDFDPALHFILYRATDRNEITDFRSKNMKFAFNENKEKGEKFFATNVSYAVAYKPKKKQVFLQIIVLRSAVSELLYNSNFAMTTDQDLRECLGIPKEQQGKPIHLKRESHSGVASNITIGFRTKEVLDLFNDKYIIGVSIVERKNVGIPEIDNLTFLLTPQ